jgi:hypothetical protein
MPHSKYPLGSLLHVWSASRTLRTLVFGLLVVLGNVAPTLARQPNTDSTLPTQTTRDAQLAIPGADVAESLQRLEDLRRWMRAFSEWHAWDVRWRNTREPGWFTGGRERQSKPAPPEWLFEVCQGLADTTGELVDACDMLTVWREGTAPTSASMAGLQAEDARKTVWWEHLHADLFWPMTPFRTSVYGVVGMHPSIQVAGRLHLFLTPGIMFLNLPGPRGREWTMATDWGVGYRLVDFRLPGTQRPVSLHVNFARAWILGRGSSPVGTAINLAGFSITFKKNR